MPDVTDPVCGLAFPEEDADALGAIKVEHEGRTHWVCCPTCERAFRDDPKRYAR